MSGWQGAPIPSNYPSTHNVAHVNELRAEIDRVRDYANRMDALAEERFVEISELKKKLDRAKFALEEIQFNDCCYEARVLADQALEVM